MDTLLAWVWAPAVLWGACLGLGLLAERICRFTLPNGLLAPVGLAGLIAIVMPGYRLGIGAWLAIAIVLGGAAAGLLLAGRTALSRARPGWAGAAALAAYVLYLAPVAFSGHWTFAGYNFVNDPSLNLVWADMLEHGGVRVLAAEPSTTATIQAAAASTNYPLGAHAVLATLRPLSGAPLAAIYQPMIAMAAALSASALFAAARRVGLPALAAVAAAVLAVGSNLVYVYGQQGAVKELFTIALLVTTAAVALEGKAAGVPAGSAALTGLSAAPMLATFSGGAGAFVAVIAVLWAVSILFEPGGLPTRRWIGATLAGGGSAALAAAPIVVSAVHFLQGAGKQFSSGTSVSTAQLGQLLRPLPLSQVAGIWIGDDYRIPVSPKVATFNAVGVAVVLGLAALAVVLEIRTRRIGVTLALAAVGIVYLVASSRLTPYVDAKLLVLASVPVVFAAAVGAWRLSVWRWWVGLPLACVMAIGVIWSDARSYNVVQLAPTDRLEALHDAADHARALRPTALWLDNEWEEYAKYFMKPVRNAMAAESYSPAPVQLRSAQPIYDQYFDLDDQRLQYVTQFRGIITRQSADASRPPASFRLAYQNRYYEVWVQDRPVKVLEHLPLQAPDQATAVPRCSWVRALAHKASRGQTLVAAVRPQSIVLDPRRLHTPRDWVLMPDGLIAPHTPATVGVERRTPSGRYRVWIRGTTGRPLRALVDGRLVGSVEEVNGPGQWLLAGEVTLPAGVHRLELSRPGGTLAPGSGYDGEIGPMELVPTQPERLEPVSSRRAAAQLCGRHLDWIERIAAT